MPNLIVVIVRNAPDISKIAFKQFGHSRNPVNKAGGIVRHKRTLRRISGFDATTFVNCKQILAINLDKFAGNAAA